MNSKLLVTTLLSDSENLSSIWERTCNVLSDIQTPLAEDYADSRSYCKALNQLVTAHLEDTCDSMLPDSGPNRSGLVIPLRKKSGSFKWSTWSGSARMMQNLSDFGTALYHGINPRDSSGALLTRGALRSSFPVTTIPKPAKVGYHQYSKLLHEAKALAIEPENIVYATKLAQELYIQMMELGEANENKSGVS